MSDNETCLTDDFFFIILTDDLLSRVAENDDFDKLVPVHRQFLRVVLTCVW